MSNSLDRRAPSACLCTAADATFFGMCLSLVMSIKAQPQLSRLDLCVFDLGLSDTQCALLRGLGCRLVIPGWDFAGVDGAVAPAWYRAMTARPYLARYFPGYEVYVWIDADAWVQEEGALVEAIQAAADGALAIAEEADHGGVNLMVSESERVVVIPEALAAKVREHTRVAFSDAVADRIGAQLPYNVGVFALARQSLVWEQWRERMSEAFGALAGGLRSGTFGQTEFIVEQMALNVAIRLDGLPIAVLPSTANWTCHLGLPSYDPATKRFVAPVTGEPIAVLHLVDLKRFRRLPIRHTDGSIQMESMHFINRIV